MNADDKAPKTLYRSAFGQMVEGYLLPNTEIHYVKGQINDDLTERAYYVFPERATPPRIIRDGEAITPEEVEAQLSKG